MIDFPAPFEDAIRYILDKEPNPAEWDSRDWSLRGSEVRTKSFFSAKVENARFLDRAQGLLFDYMAGTTEQVVGPDGVTRTAIKTGGRDDFVRRMRRFMISEGMATEKEFENTDQEDLQDIKSEERLRLIFDTNVRQAYGFGHYKQGMKPAVLKRFPAARLIRERGVSEPRPRHARHENEVRLKTNSEWWADYINAEEIGGFGVSWGPYGFGSGMGQEDVSREEAVRLGLPVEVQERQQEPDNSKLTDGLEVKTDKMDPAIKAKLLEELRSGPNDAMSRARQAGRDAARRARERNGASPLGG